MDAEGMRGGLYQDVGEQYVFQVNDLVPVYDSTDWFIHHTRFDAIDLTI